MYFGMRFLPMTPCPLLPSPHPSVTNTHQFMGGECRLAYCKDDFGGGGRGEWGKKGHQTRKNKTKKNHFGVVGSGQCAQLQTVQILWLKLDRLCVWGGYFEGGEGASSSFLPRLATHSLFGCVCSLLATDTVPSTLPASLVCVSRFGNQSVVILAAFSFRLPNAPLLHFLLTSAVFARAKIQFSSSMTGSFHSFIGSFGHNVSLAVILHLQGKHLEQ
ncbi:hypothetical protein E2320_013355, partial [Naja naja]